MVSLLQTVKSRQQSSQGINTHPYKIQESQCKKTLKIREICAICDNPRFRQIPVRLGNRTIGVNLVIFRCVLKSSKGRIFSTAFLQSVCVLKCAFYVFQGFNDCLC